MWLPEELRAVDLDTTLDASVFLIGLARGAQQGLQSILLDSHSDTVPSGGGILCVLHSTQVLIRNGGLRHFRTLGRRWRADVVRDGRPREFELKVSDPKHPVVRRP